MQLMQLLVIILIMINIYLLYDKLNSKEGMANMADVDITAIKSLSDIAQMLQKEGGLTIPGDLTIAGKLNVKGITTSEGDVNVKGTITSEGDLNVAKTITSKNLNAAHAKLTTISDVNILTGNHITLEHNLIVKGMFNAESINGKSGHINGKEIDTK
jgi:predicted phage tail protein